MTELHFVEEPDVEGGWIARAVGADIFTQADSLEVLDDIVPDAVTCHFEPDRMPKLIRLHIVQDRVLAA
ncbi:MAG: 2-oxoisovalerate dehydrogenase [Deltaproteobacteria bacterium]|nr:2-oxoisovalerate dehydrogenase [Deltaproteobacteria bacterium]